MSTPFTRDTGTLGEDGPELTAAETGSARDMEAPGLVNEGTQGGQAEAEHQRPRFSPVGQPGMVEEIHWHTVKSEQRAAPPPGRQEHRRGHRGRGHRKGRRRG